MDYDAEGDGKVLLNENHVETCCLLERMSNTRERTITLDVEKEDYYGLKNVRGSESVIGLFLP